MNRSASFPQTTVESIFEYFREIARNTAEKGRLFELFCKQFFRCSPIYGQNIDEIWLWNKWSFHTGPDIRIDLVACRTDGSWVAIQCKFFANCPIDKFAVDSFLSATAGNFIVATARKSSLPNGFSFRPFPSARTRCKR